ncbi:Rrf2 family transcriptional regulator [Streptomyces rubradiris]|uniref:Rrf2 family transcriptional regulator n=1 Tax=Streptomyces rubradiris TaxID=285531 RepID=A0ABQ3RP98_STRRR|nr:Rrf2 family transcriptional regulator [Streptomyces rubradiris]GHH12384.1 Rrf2 family transcriptional regulator [Streptomyces rubradiris]GHI57602.1 Rrf2 family transcriptional regulator [Streptomyces rubradiris]
MSANSRLTIAAHALAWIGLYQRHGHEVATSEQIATSANTNPVVIRRLLGELRRAGLVESRRGVGAGWSLAREPSSMTLLDVYEAVEPGPLFAMHRATPDQGCVVGRAIQPTMRSIYEGIEETLRRELARVTLEDVIRDVLAASSAASGNARPVDYFT